MPFCRNCGKELSPQAAVCVACGVPPPKGEKFCQNCGAEVAAAAEVCIRCGVRLVKAEAVAAGEGKNWLVALLLSIFVGQLGIDRFYLGYVGTGILKLLITVLTLGFLGWIWWLVDIILIATNKMKDSKGRPLAKK